MLIVQLLSLLLQHLGMPLVYLTIFKRKLYLLRLYQCLLGIQIYYEDIKNQSKYAMLWQYKRAINYDITAKTQDIKTRFKLVSPNQVSAYKMKLMNLDLPRSKMRTTKHLKWIFCHDNVSEYYITVFMCKFQQIWNLFNKV